MVRTGASEPAEIRSRRRGATLEQAIYQATLQELAITGYAGLTMDGIARRAQTGKAALYRRWASKKDLVLDALLRVLPDPREIGPHGSVRDNLLAALAIMTDTLAGRAAYPSLGVMIDVLGEPELRQAFATRVIKPRLRIIQTILREAVARGEIHPETATPLVARTGPALVLQAILLTGKPPTRAELTRIVDTILLPLLVPPS